jgi:hypothetical protein
LNAGGSDIHTSTGIAINLRTAKAFGLTISPALLTRADELIE